MDSAEQRLVSAGMGTIGRLGWGTQQHRAPACSPSHKSHLHTSNKPLKSSLQCYRIQASCKSSHSDSISNIEMLAFCYQLIDLRKKPPAVRIKKLISVAQAQSLPPPVQERLMLFSVVLRSAFNSKYNALILNLMHPQICYRSNGSRQQLLVGIMGKMFRHCIKNQTSKLRQVYLHLVFKHLPGLCCATNSTARNTSEQSCVQQVGLLFIKKLQ